MWATHDINNDFNINPVYDTRAGVRQYHFIFSELPKTTSEEFRTHICISILSQINTSVSVGISSVVDSIHIYV